MMDVKNYEHKGVTYEAREQGGQFQFYVEYQGDLLHKTTSVWYDDEREMHKAARWLIDCYI